MSETREMQVHFVKQFHDMYLDIQVVYVADKGDTSRTSHGRIRILIPDYDDLVNAMLKAKKYVNDQSRNDPVVVKSTTKESG